jgi:hypothetical protein
MHCHVNEQFLVQGNQGKYCQNMLRSLLIQGKFFFMFPYSRYFFMLHSSFLTVCGGVTYDTGDEDTECDHQLVHSYQDTPKKIENA